jgi:hypothetical protein
MLTSILPVVDIYSINIIDKVSLLKLQYKIYKPEFSEKNVYTAN